MNFKYITAGYILTLNDFKVLRERSAAGMENIIDESLLEKAYENCEKFKESYAIRRYQLALQIFLLTMLMEEAKNRNTALFWILWVRGILVLGYASPIVVGFFPQLNVIPVAAVAHWAIVVALSLGILIELWNIVRAAVRIYKAPEEDNCLVNGAHRKSRQVFRIIHLLIDIVKLALFSFALLCVLMAMFLLPF